jgi:DNA polymerase III epsilon subunit-like protein
MSGFLVVDTETSGLFDFARPADAEGQPRLASIAMLFCDAQWRLQHQWFTLVRPDGWDMPAAAEAINGLSTARLEAEGVDVSVPLAIYSGAVACGRTVVAYNVQYDLKIMRGALRRAGYPDLYHATDSLCIMEAMTPICAVPSARGVGYKWPKLTEAYAYLVGKLEGAHGALADASACLRLAQELHAMAVDMPIKRAA